MMKGIDTATEIPTMSIVSIKTNETVLQGLHMYLQTYCKCRAVSPVESFGNSIILIAKKAVTNDSGNYNMSGRFIVSYYKKTHKNDCDDCEDQNCLTLTCCCNCLVLCLFSLFSSGVSLGDVGLFLLEIHKMDKLKN